MMLYRLDFSSLMNNLNKHNHKRDPKGHNPITLFNTLIAIQVEKNNDFKRLKE